MIGELSLPWCKWGIMTAACYFIWSAIPPNEVGRGIRLPDLRKCGIGKPIFWFRDLCLQILSGQSHRHPKGYRVVSFPILEKSGRRASPSAYNDDSVKKETMMCGREWAYRNKILLGIENAIDSLWNVAQVKQWRQITRYAFRTILPAVSFVQ